MTMMPLTNIIFVLILMSLLSIQTVASDGLFYLRRDAKSCISTTVITTTDNTVSDNCYILSWNQFTTSTTYYTIYMDPITKQSYYAQIGALTVLGQIDNHNLSSQCPPAGYNGIIGECMSLPNTQIVVMHINVADGKLYAIDVFLSGFPFPALQNLKKNQPPFGTARHIFNSGVTIETTGYLKICKNSTSNQCPFKDSNARTLPDQLANSYGYGFYGLQAGNMLFNATWIVDRQDQVVIDAAPGNYFFFLNRTGFFSYTVADQTCPFFASCDFQCESTGYNSRFLDYAGEWIITNKWSLGQIEPITADVWIGITIIIGGVNPIIMYFDKKSGNYIGLDKADLVGSPTMGSMFWYTKFGDTIPKVTVESFHPTAAELGCNVTGVQSTFVENNNVKNCRKRKIRKQKKGL